MSVNVMIGTSVMKTQNAMILLIATSVHAIVVTLEMVFHAEVRIISTWTVIKQNNVLIAYYSYSNG